MSRRIEGKGPLCRPEDVPEGGARGFVMRIGDKRRRIFLVRHQGELHAYLNSCPHAGTPLDWTPDTFLDREGKYILCQTHAAYFEIDTGFCVAGPCAGDNLQPVEITTDENGFLHYAGN